MPLSDHPLMLRHPNDGRGVDDVAVSVVAAVGELGFAARSVVVSVAGSPQDPGLSGPLLRPQCRSLCPARTVVCRQPVAAGQHALSGQHLAGSPYFDVVFHGVGLCSCAGDLSGPALIDRAAGEPAANPGRVLPRRSPVAALDAARHPLLAGQQPAGGLSGRRTDGGAVSG